MSDKNFIIYVILLSIFSTKKPRRCARGFFSLVVGKVKISGSGIALDNFLNASEGGAVLVADEQVIFLDKGIELTNFGLADVVSGVLDRNGSGIAVDESGFKDEVAGSLDNVRHVRSRSLS